jgi:uncharacterized membrane protein YoaK (UPF0700 family)/pimeloyl-ACP methyl ester carboxylesterase
MAVKEQAHFDDLLLTGSLLVLTFSTGLVDAASFLALGHVLTANMTGNVVFTAFALAGVPGHSITRSALALLSALAGAAVAGHIDKKLVWKRRNVWLSASFAIEAILLAFAFCVAWFTRGQPIEVSTVNSLIVLAAFSMGIRNGAVRRLAVPDLTTTVLTLTVIGLAFDSFIAGGDNLRWPRKVGSIVMMFMGAATGAMLLRYSLSLVLGWAALLTVFCAIIQLLRNETEHEARLDVGMRRIMPAEKDRNLTVFPKEQQMSNSMKPIRVVRGISQSLCIVFLMFTCGVLSAQNKEYRVRNIVLVHGAWADGSGWKGVYDILAKDGFNVSIVQEPETSFQDDVNAVKRILALQDGPSILVAHSYGGAVITEAGNDPSVVGLVYIAAHMPDSGEKESEDGKRFPSDLAKSGAIKKTPDGFTYIDPAQFHELFAADLPGDKAAFMARSQVLNFADNFSATITTAAWRTKPSWMLVAGSDRTISPDLERWYAMRAHSHTVEVAGASHSVYVSHTKEVADVIESAAGAVSK